jgi:ketosteroid isomerase-like protein
MADTRSDVRDTLGGMVDRAKEAFGGTPSAEHAEGRVEAVREALLAFGDGEFDRFFEDFAEDVEWIAPKGEKFPGAGAQQGTKQIKEHFVATIERSYATFGFEPTHFLEGPEEPWVVVLGAFVGEGATGGKLEAAAAQVWTFEKDKVSRVDIYTDSDAFPEPQSEKQANELREKADAEEGEHDQSVEDSDEKR